MSKLYICPDHECFVNNNRICYHGILHKKDGHCNKKCGGGVICALFPPAPGAVKMSLKVITSKDTPKATREYMRSK